MFLLQYPSGNELASSCGEIVSIKNKDILHNCSTVEGSDGAPLILRARQLSVIGIHKESENRGNYNFAISIHSIINDLKKQLGIFKSINYKEKYKNLEKIGNGNFGTVYKGKNDEGNFRALKIIDKEEMRNRIRINDNKDDIEEEFKLDVEDKLYNEIEIMRMCMRNNINSVQFYEFYDTEKEYALVMELCDDNLQYILNKKNTGFSVDEILDIIKQLNNTFKIMSEKK